MELMELTRDPRFHATSGVLKEAAVLLEALRIGLMQAEADDYDREHMTDGEIAITRGQRDISKKLSTIISMMEEGVYVRPKRLKLVSPTTDGNLEGTER